MCARQHMVHIRLSEELAAALDKLVRTRNVSRNRFITEAIAEKLAREERILALRETQCALGPEDAVWAAVPAADWVRKVRSDDRGAPVWPT